MSLRRCLCVGVFALVSLRWCRWVGAFGLVLCCGVFGLVYVGVFVLVSCCVLVGVCVYLGCLGVCECLVGCLSEGMRGRACMVSANIV